MHTQGKEIVPSVESWLSLIWNVYRTMKKQIAHITQCQVQTHNNTGDMMTFNLDLHSFVRLFIFSPWLGSCNVSLIPAKSPQPCWSTGFWPSSWRLLSLPSTPNMASAPGSYATASRDCWCCYMDFYWLWRSMSSWAGWVCGFFKSESHWQCCWYSHNRHCCHLNAEMQSLNDTFIKEQRLKCFLSF